MYNHPLNNHNIIF